MLKLNEREYKPDIMSVLIKEAADARGLHNIYRNFPSKKELCKYRTWLNFQVGGNSYYYIRGALLEAGANKWGGLGRNINHKAKLLIFDKFGTKNLLKDLGFSVPDGWFFRRRNLDKAINSFDTFKKPVCVKPNNGSLGELVFPGIESRHWYEFALNKVAEEKPTILVEESVTGHHFRFFYVYPKVVGIRLGIPMHVIGDGIASIEELLEEKNSERRRRALPTHPPYDLDQKTLDFLAMQNLTHKDIPAMGQRVYLSGASNGPAGADTFLLDKEELHPSYCAIVEKACKSIPGLHVTGIDIIVENINQPAEKGNYWILEMNINSAIAAFYYPWEGKTVDVAGLMLDFLAEHSDFS